MSDLKGKVALVTGGTGGIGAAICVKLATSGARVATNYRNEEKAKTWQAEVKKAGMHGFTMALAQEVAHKGVTVNTVSTGYIATEMVMTVPENIRISIIESIPVNRLGIPEEVAALVDFLASEEAGFATGTDLSMNGGQHMM